MLREKRRHANSKPNRKLDRKSSRGMIYENEELRLRTININAEVERGQSDIKKLRRENDHLRREIWSLRDEYDRLDKLLRSNPQQPQNAEIGERLAGVERASIALRGHEAAGDDGESDDNEEDEDDDEVDDEDDEEDEEPSCEHCQQYEDSCECNFPDKINSSIAAPFRPQPKPRTNFDDLSVVSEETTHSTDTVVTDPDTHRLSSNAPPLGAFEYQSNVPSLAHFENLCYEQIGPNLTSSGELVYPKSPNASADTKARTMQEDDSGAYTNEAITPPSQPSSLSPSTVSTSFQSSKNGPPDICMYTAGMPLRLRQRGGQQHNSSTGCFPTGGNLDDLLHDLDNLTVDHSLTLAGDKAKRNKRTEMNLILSHDGVISSISQSTTSHTPVTPAAIPISVDSPTTTAAHNPQQQTMPPIKPPPPAVGWRPEIPAKPDKVPKSKFSWIGRAVQPADSGNAPQIPTPTASQSEQQLRRNSIPAVALVRSPNSATAGQAPAKTGPVTATISKRRFSLMRRSSVTSTGGGAAAAAAAANSTAPGAGGGPTTAGPSVAHGGGGSSAERTTTTHGGSVSSSSPESSTSLYLRSQRSQPRRISTGSHDNATGSIPWCACWGNGCI